MIAAIDLIEMGDGVDGGEEATVEPTASLQDEFGHGVGHVRLAVGRLDVLQDPATIALRHQLEAEDTILGQVHVGGEDARIGAVHLLAEEVLLQRAFAELVVLQRDVPVRGEGAGQDGDIPEERLEGLVEDVRDLVLEVLGGD